MLSPKIPPSVKSGWRAPPNNCGGVVTAGPLCRKARSPSRGNLSNRLQFKNGLADVGVIAAAIYKSLQDRVREMQGRLFLRVGLRKGTLLRRITHDAYR